MLEHAAHRWIRCGVVNHPPNIAGLSGGIKQRNGAKAEDTRGIHRSRNQVDDDGRRQLPSGRCSPPTAAIRSSIVGVAASTAGSDIDPKFARRAARTGATTSGAGLRLNFTRPDNPNCSAWAMSEYLTTARHGRTRTHASHCFTNKKSRWHTLCFYEFGRRFLRHLTDSKEFP